MHSVPGTTSRDLTRLAFNAAPTAMALSSLTGLLLHTNPAFHALFGLPRQMLPEGLNFTGLCSDDAAATLFESVARDGQTRQSELEMYCGTHGRRRVLCVTSRVDDDQATPVWLATVCFQLQSQHLVEQRRLHELHHFLEAQHLAGSGSWQIQVENDDLAANLMLCSPALSQLLGQRAQITERPVAAFLQHLHPQDRAQWLATLREAVEGAESCQVDYRLMPRNGATLNMRSYSTCTWRQPGRSPTVIGIEQNATEVRELRQELGLKTALLRSVFDDCDQPLYAMDHSLRYICFNATHREQMLRDHGHEPRVGQRMDSPAAAPREQRRIHEHLRRALAGQPVVHDVVGETTTAAGEGRDVIYQPVLDDTGQVTSVMVSEKPARPRATRQWQD